MTWPSDQSSVFGLPTELRAEQYRELRDALRRLWHEQTRQAPKIKDDVAHDQGALLQQLDQMRHWFDPVASGRRVRDLIGEAPAIDPTDFDVAPLAVVNVAERRGLLTPEGRAILWILDRTDLGWSTESTSAQRTVILSSSDAYAAVACVHEVYRRWVQKKLASVDQLLQQETSTLRPTAAGLLFFLLLNRHTSPARGLPLPPSAEHSDAVSRAISGPVIAFARAISGSDKSSEKGVALYRGWALGEVRRRLGSGLHEAGDAVWIDEQAIDRAVQRLRESVLSGRNETQVSAAIAAARAAYEDSRSRLAALGIAFERPSNTARLTSAFASGMDTGLEI